MFSPLSLPMAIEMMLIAHARRVGDPRRSHVLIDDPARVDRSIVYPEPGEIH
jgi:hypothetical protein